MEIEYSDRIKKIAPPVFLRMENIKLELGDDDVIYFGSGESDLNPPERVIKRLIECCQEPRLCEPAPFGGLPELKKAIANWYDMRFGVSVDPKTEVLVLNGTKSALGKIPQAFINPGEGVLSPSPAHPVYQGGVFLAGGSAVGVPLLEEKDYLPDLDIIDRKALDRSKMLFMNYPSNPIGAMANEEFFNKVAHFAKRTEMIVCHDNSYSEIYYGGNRPISYLQAKNAKEHHGIEFHSLSLTFNLTGFRVGFAVGNKKIVDGLSRLSAFLDSGVFQPIQQASIVALEQGWKDAETYRKEYEKRCEVMCAELTRTGFEFKKPEAGYFLWVRVPLGFSSETFSEFLLKEARVAVVPGTAFGIAGQGFIRFSLIQSEAKIKAAFKKIEGALKKR